MSTSSHRSETTNDQQTILLVEDERDLNELLAYNLGREGYRVLAAVTGEEALQIVRTEVPDLVLLDLMLPAMDGLEVCRALKAKERTAEIPIVMLTAKGEETDIVKGLELGADDYVTKPFSPRVLMARIDAVMRRTKPASVTPGSQKVFEVAGIRLDEERHEVWVHGDSVTLTATEFKLLKLLIARPGRVFPRQSIIQSIHDGFAAVTDRSVDVQVVALRRKLGDTGSAIETVRGVGYRFKD